MILHQILQHASTEGRSGLVVTERTLITSRHSVITVALFFATLTLITRIRKQQVFLEFHGNRRLRTQDSQSECNLEWKSKAAVNT